MPFTFAHPVFVLPFTRPLRRLPLSAMVIGSMTPDASIFFPYLRFHGLRLQYVFNHSLKGIFTVDLMAGLIFFALFHGVFKLPLLALLPMPWARRLLHVAQGTRLAQPLMNWLLIAAGLTFGALTHLWVDSCTHGYGWPTQRFAAFHAQVPVVHLPLFKFLQYTFSVLGLAVTALWGGHWLRRAPMEASVAEVRDALHPLPRPNLVRGSAPTVALLALACGLWFSLAIRHDLTLHTNRTPTLHTRYRTVVAHVCVGATPIVAAALTLYACLWNRAHAKQPWITRSTPLD